MRVIATDNALKPVGHYSQAIEHALKIGNKVHAADLIELHAKNYLHQGRVQVKDMLAWYEQLPGNLLQSRPILHIYRAWAHVFDNPFKHKKD